MLIAQWAVRNCGRQSSKIFAGLITIACKSSTRLPVGSGSGIFPSSSPLIMAANLSTSSYTQYVKHQTTDVVKSQEDKRDYRALELVNGLKVLLVSDPTTDKAAASMDVSVGHLCDPRDLPGLAHFCEHMLFLGTEKFPVENDYQKFIATHGGSSNAFTGTDHTNYHFDVAPEHLEQAIDRFAQFFICPLFTSSATEREVNAVDSEHSNNVQNDVWRLAQLERSLSNPNHDYSKFGTGNRKTLLEEAKARGEDPREELLKFHNKYYSSNIMCLCVVGKQSLDELASFVIPLVANAHDKNVVQPYWHDHAYGSEQLGYRLNVVPVKDLRSMHVSFPIPDMHKHYKSNPSHYVSHLLGHEGPGSLLSELKNRGWANSLVAGPRTGGRGFAFFAVDVDLSEEGLEHVEDILELLFEYINMLKHVGPLEWIHRECEDLNKMDFRFKDKERPMGYATVIASAMHYYPPDEVLYAPYMMSEFEPDLINVILNKLSPDNMNFAVISKKFEGQADLKEQWYGTDYSKTRIDTDLLERCRNAKENASLHLPDKNDFIPTDFKLFQLERTLPNGERSMPELLRSDQIFRVWFKQDDEFLLPKCCLFFQMRSPLVYSDPLNASLAVMYVELLKDSLTEYTYDAELAGLRYGLENGKYGLGLSISGYNEKQPVLLKKLLQRMVTFVPNPRRFEILKERYLRSIRNFQMEQPYTHAVYYTNFLMSENAWSKEELLQEAEGLTVEMLNNFVSRFLSSLFIEALIHGNATKEEGKKIVELVKETLHDQNKLRPLFSNQLTRDREVCLSEGSTYVFKAENTTHANSSLEIFLQIGVEDTRLNMLVELLAQILQEPCYDQLRTKEQLGYIVFSGVRRAHGTQGLRFIVQSDRSPDFVKTRVELFLLNMKNELRNMSTEEFEKHKAALAAKRLEKPNKLSTRAAKYWSEINIEQYHFDRDHTEVRDLEKITKDELEKFYEDYITITSAKRKTLGVFVYSAQTKDKKREEFEEAQIQSEKDLVEASGDGKKLTEPEKITSILAFKSSLPLYPLPRPHITVPQGGVNAPKSML